VKVCIVEDSDAVRERLSAMLTETAGVEVVGTASGAKEAITIVRERRPDVVVLDLQLSDGSGLDVLKRIRQDGPEPLVMILTIHASAQFRERCLKAGADYFFDKAIEFGKVQEVCQQRLKQEEESIPEETD
jgi:DNA-binding NarL/FixJ family response regulator